MLRIIDGTTVDGPGFRTSVYFAGCRHECPGCHNPQSWNFSAGEELTISELMRRIEDNDMDVTFSGGDPLYHWRELTPLAQAVRKSGRKIWCYTGFLFEELAQRPELRPLLECIDVIVDGPFKIDLRDTTLLFRGSSNQRLIRVADTLRDGAIVSWTPEF